MALPDQSRGLSWGAAIPPAAPRRRSPREWGALALAALALALCTDPLALPPSWLAAPLLHAGVAPGAAAHAGAMQLLRLPSMGPRQTRAHLPPTARSPHPRLPPPAQHRPEADGRLHWGLWAALAALVLVAGVVGVAVSQPRPAAVTALALDAPPEDPVKKAPALPSLADDGAPERSEGAPMLIGEVAGLPFGLGVALQWAVLISPFFFWGTSMVAMEETIARTGPLFVAGVRCVPAGLLILAFSAFKGQPLLPRTAKAWAWVLAFTVVDGTLFQTFLAEGLRRTSAGLGSVIIDSQPLTVAVLASLLFGEALGARGVAGLLLGVLGISLVEVAPESLDAIFDLAGGSWSTGALWDRGEWWMLLAAQSMALGTIMVRLFAKEVDAVVATGWHLLLGGLPLFALAAAVDGPLADQTALLTAADWLRLAYVSVCGGALSFGLFFFAAERGSLTRLSSLTFLTPVFAVLGDYLFLSETLSPIQAAGAAVTLLAIYLINSPK